ncbi:MAG: hypothetical protein IJC71_05550, partial [Clostridia bacterium]|nr:hypothetical protein [Clostridia bacterium]
PSKAEMRDVLLYRTDTPSAGTYEIRKLMSRTDDNAPAALARFACISGALSYEEADAVRQKAASVTEQNLVRRLSMLTVTGSDLTPCGFRGKEIGEKLSEALDAVMRGEIGNTKDEIIHYLTN